MLILPTTCITRVIGIGTGISIPIGIVQLLSSHVLLNLSEELLLMKPIMLVSQFFLPAEFLLEDFFLSEIASETGKVLELLCVVDLELVVTLLTLQSDHRLVQTT